MAVKYNSKEGISKAIDDILRGEIEEIKFRACLKETKPINGWRTWEHTGQVIATIKYRKK